MLCIMFFKTRLPMGHSKIRTYHKSSLETILELPSNPGQAGLVATDSVKSSGCPRLHISELGWFK